MFQNVIGGSNELNVARHTCGSMLRIHITDDVGAVEGRADLVSGS